MEGFVNSAVALVISLIAFGVCVLVEHITRSDVDWRGEKTTLNKLSVCLGLGCLAFAGLCILFCVAEVISKVLGFLWDNLFVYAAFLMLGAGIIFLIYRFFRYIIRLFRK